MPWVLHTSSHLFSTQVANPALLGTCTFPALLVGEGMQDLSKVRPASRAPAERQQRRIARRRRDALRELLRRAARLGALPWGKVHIADFSESGEVLTTADAFVNLDEDLPGDSEFNSINLDQESTATSFFTAAAGDATALELPAWLMLELRPTTNEVGSQVACHIGLATWGRATVVELDNIGKGTTRYLCAEGCWRALGIGRIGIEWRPCGRGDTLVFSSADGPVLDSDVPRLLKFEDPVLEDQAHTHAFIFSSEEVRRLAAKLLHCTL